MPQVRSNFLEPEVSDALHAALSSIRSARSETTAYGKGGLYARLQMLTDELKDILGEKPAAAPTRFYEYIELTSWLMANGENPQIVCAMLRWTNLNMLSQYAHGFKADKLEAQGTVLQKLVREPNRESDAEKYGRHEETRTPDLYRVKRCSGR
jgi:hypothetical protein